MNKKTIIRNFSRSAYSYDRYADVQRRVASELLMLIKENNISKILEIGCGTGNYTLLLREKFKNAKFEAIDISDKMIEVASVKLKNKGIEFIVSDAEIVNLDGDFDLITSNACFQWFDDLDGTLIKYKNLLKKDGFILFSIFGPATFWELNKSLEYISKNISTSVTDFPPKEKIKKILNDNFREVEMKESIYEESFSCLRDLLNKIKYTGIRGDGLRSRIFLTPQFLKELEEIYLSKFNQIKATYQIFFCQALR